MASRTKKNSSFINHQYNVETEGVSTKLICAVFSSEALPKSFIMITDETKSKAMLTAKNTIENSASLGNHDLFDLVWNTFTE